MTATANSLRQTAEVRARSRAVAAKGSALPARDRIPKIVRWSFIAFAITLPFEAADLGFTSSSFSLAKLSGLAFIGWYFFYYNAISGKRPCPPVSAPLWCFLAYLTVYLANGFFLNQVYFGQFVSIFLTLVQLSVLFWISSNLLQDEWLARQVLMAFALAAVVSALGTLLHVPGFSEVIKTRMGARVTSLEFNPNFLAYSMALAAVILTGLGLDLYARSPWKSFLLMALTLPLLAIIVQTGSRGGLGAFAIGFAAYLLPNRQSQRSLVVVGLGVFVVTAMTYLVIVNPTVLTRMQETYLGNLVDRRVIMSASWEMAWQRPFLGWQPVAFWGELGHRLGQLWGVKDAHNLVFHLILEVGLVGAVPFLIGLYLCVRYAWTARSGALGMLPLALMLTTLSANLTHTYLTRKPQWLILALAVGAGMAAARKTQFSVVRRPLGRSL